MNEKAPSSNRPSPSAPITASLILKDHSNRFFRYDFSRARLGLFCFALVAVGGVGSMGMALIIGMVVGPSVQESDSTGLGSSSHASLSSDDENALLAPGELDEPFSQGAEEGHPGSKAWKVADETSLILRQVKLNPSRCQSGVKLSFLVENIAGRKTFGLVRGMYHSSHLDPKEIPLRFYDSRLGFEQNGSFFAFKALADEAEVSFAIRSRVPKSFTLSSTACHAIESGGVLALEVVEPLQHRVHLYSYEPANGKFVERGRFAFDRAGLSLQSATHARLEVSD